MTDPTRALLRYWRKSILDANSFPGTAADIRSRWPCSLDNLEQGRLAGHALKEWQRKLDETRKESGELAVVPFVYQKSRQAGAGPGYKKIFFSPFICRVRRIETACSYLVKTHSL